jgi:hypothetical protein
MSLEKIISDINSRIQELTKFKKIKNLHMGPKHNELSTCVLT